MRNLNVLATLMVAVIGLSACSSTDDNIYVGSRDDIIINNKNMPKAVKETPTSTTDVVKTSAVETAKSAETVVTEGANDVKEAIVKSETAVIPNTVTPAQAAVNAAAPASPNVTTSVTATVPPATAPQQTNVVWDAPAAPTNNSCNVSEVPPSATPGECYAKVLIPAQTQTTTERVQVAEEQKVLNRIIPAQYRVETEQVLVKEGRKYWKQGTGAVTKVNEVTGEILCLIEEPPVYKTIEKRVLVAPEKPEYRLVPAQFEDVKRTQVIKPECWEWRRVLCETNMTTATIQTIQNALRSKGYKIAVDGNLGAETMSAIRSYQKKNGLAVQGLTYETLSHLGIQVRA